MKKYLLVLISGLIFTSLTGQENRKSETVQTITIEELRDHIYYLASDELEGRLPGTPGIEKAMEYAVTQFRQAGLIPFHLSSDSRLSYYKDLTVNKYLPHPDNQIKIIRNTGERTFTFEDNYIIGYDNNFEIREIAGGLAFIGYGIREPAYGIDEYKNIDVKGKWVVTLPYTEELPEYIRKKIPQGLLQKYQKSSLARLLNKLQNAFDAGAIGLIEVSTSSYTTDRWKRIALSNRVHYNIPGLSNLDFGEKCPLVKLDSAMTDYLFNQEKYNPVRNKGSYKSFLFENAEFRLKKEYEILPIKTANVVALIEGSDPNLKNEYIALTAHIDHLGIDGNEIFNGADDDASGCASVFEISEALAKSKLRRSVICILFTGEEFGLLGSYYFTENPPVTLKNIIADVNIDMIGRPDTVPNEFSSVGADRINPKLKEIINAVNKKTSDFILDTVNHNNDFMRGDQYTFHLKRIPSVMFTSLEHDDYHTPADDPEKIDYEFLQKSCQLIYEIILELANGDINLIDQGFN